MINEDRPCGNCGYPERAHVPGDDHIYDGVGGSLSAAPIYPQAKWSPRKTLLAIVAGSLLGWLVVVHTAHLFVN